MSMRGSRMGMSVKLTVAGGIFATMASLVFLPAPALASGHIKPGDRIQSSIQFEECFNKKDSYCNTRPGTNVTKYTRVAFKPLKFRLHPQSEYRGVDPAGFKLVSNMFHQTLIGQLEPEYQVVNYVNPQTLAVHATLVDLKLKKTDHTRKDTTYGGLGISAAQDKISEAFQMSDAAIETEYFDGEKGQRLAVSVDKHLYENPASTEPWESMRQGFKNYARRIKARLDLANKR
ncbi:MAG: DUF3313 domain-containing protein [Gammaproteobacteria bacterium]|nr:DUF3313 domain-containing protein [Gammaproteobacteria bacterium]